MKPPRKLPLHPAHRAHTAGPEQAGFALIEVLVSLLMFSLGVLGLVAMQTKATGYAVAAEDRTRAAMLANEIIACMWAEQSTSPSTLTAWAARVADPTVSGLPNATSSVSTDSSTGITTVTITWKSPSKLSTEASSKYFTYVVIP
ncbi:MAG: type IV pilus modification protein PilV [Burkholderiales bacterium]|nr:type IV pilus modification protein PilV [Burkholderiales bacterium]